MSTIMKLESLPNEILLECFQYLDTLDILYSFDRLNYRFDSFIQNISLHVNLHHFKKSSFNQLCEILLTNPKIKEYIISLQLSNIYPREQIISFIPKLLLNEFIHFKSLSLIDLKDYNTKQVLPILSDLECFFCTSLQYGNSKIRRLKKRNFDINSLFIYKNMSITSLTICNCDLFDLWELFKYIPMLKKLNIGYFHNSKMNDLNLNNTYIVDLKELIIDYSKANFYVLQLLLERLPNLNILSICASDNIEMIDADRWQHLIESSLIHLHLFKFNFAYCTIDSYTEKLNKVQEFQTDFWIKQHQWYTIYEIDEYLVLIYTMPYIGYEYRFNPTVDKYINSLINYSDGFNNLKNVTVWIKPIKKDLCYFPNIQSLTLTSKNVYDDERDEYRLSEKQIIFLQTTVNLSNIKELIIDTFYITELLLLKILIHSPNLSTLTIECNTLILHLKNSQLCELLNKQIIKLDISDDNRNMYIKSNDIDSFSMASNCKQIRCPIITLDNLLLILSKCTKLSMIMLGKIHQDIYSWIQINTSTLNIDLHFTLID